MPLLSRTGLPVETNREIWRLARFFGPRGGDHNLSEVGFMVMNRLVAHAQPAKGVWHHKRASDTTVRRRD